MIWGIGIVLLLGLGITGAVLVTARSLPSYDKLKSSQAGQMIVVRANDGSEIVTLGPSYGKWIPYNRIPQPMKDALVSVEDRRFREHWGVDPVGIIRSVMVRAQSGRWRQGGSTITQQLARNIFLNNSRTFDRKIREAICRWPWKASFPRTRFSSSISTRSTSAAAPMAWIRRAQVLRPFGRAAFAGRGGDHRRPGQGAFALFAHGRCPGRRGPRQGGAGNHGRCRHADPGASGGGQSQQRAPRRRAGPELRPLFHRLGAAAA
jgi:hypothetical protein